MSKPLCNQLKGLSKKKTRIHTHNNFVDQFRDQFSPVQISGGKLFLTIDFCDKIIKIIEVERKPPVPSNCFFDVP